MIKPESSRPLARALAIMASGLLACGQPAAAGPFPDAAEPQMRVATIGYRLATRNRALCPRDAPVTGLLLHDLGSYAARLRPEIGERFGMSEGVGVLGAVPGSVADRTGLTAGDEIVSLNGTAMGQLGLPPLSQGASYDRVEAFTRLLQSGLVHGSVSLGIRRGDRSRTVTLPRELGCAAPVALVPGTKPDAWSDAHYAAVTQGLAAVASDDELAFALAHEMAHVLLQHAAEPHGMLTGIGIGGKRSREREREADRLGIRMSVGAGYAPQGARALLERFARVNAPAISLTHPSVRARLAAITAEAQALTGPQSVP